MPVAAALATLIVAPKNMKVLLTDPMGVRLVLVAVVLQVLGALAIRKIVDIEY